MAREELNKKKEYSTSDFLGVNTAALRQAIKPGEQAWLENIQPIGPANAKVLPGMSAVITTISGKTIYYAQGFNIIISGTPCDIIICADTGGDIYSINLTLSTLTPISAGGGAAGKFTQTSACQWKNERILFIDSNNGLYDWDGTTLNNAGYNSPPAQGQCIATFSGRVWVSANRTVYWSAPGSYSDWRSASGGSNAVITDETLHSSIQQLVSTSNFLYVFGIDSCNVFSDVQPTTSSTTSPPFTNTNLSTGVGTAFPMSICTYGRSIWFASANGFYAMYGASARKESTNLDGMYPLIRNVTSPAAIGAVPTFSTGLVTLNNILCVAYLFNYFDPAYATNTPNYRPLLALYFDGKWFFANQGNAAGVGALTMIVDCVVKGVNKLYGFDSSGNFYQLFTDTTSSVQFKWQTALWDFNQPVMFKQITKVGVGVQFAALASTVNCSADTENVSNSIVLTSGSTLTFVGTGPIQFQNAFGLNINFLSSGYTLLQSDISNFGRYVGFTLTGGATQATFTLAMLEYNLRSQWGT